LRSKRIGVTGLIFQGHVTSSVTCLIVHTPFPIVVLAELHFGRGLGVHHHNWKDVDNMTVIWEGRT